MTKRLTGLLLLGVLFAACSKDNSSDNKSATQLITEGWQAYSARDYTTAASDFAQAVAKDANQVDGYNGAGWSNAKLFDLTKASSGFTSGLARDSSNAELQAGIAFVYSAQKNYAQSVVYALKVVTANPSWTFSHDATITVSTLHLLLAEDYFAQAAYDLSLQQVVILNPSFNADPTSVSGQTSIAKEIERLRSIV